LPVECLNSSGVLDARRQRRSRSHFDDPPSAPGLQCLYRWLINAPCTRESAAHSRRAAACQSTLSSHTRWAQSKRAFRPRTGPSNGTKSSASRIQLERPSEARDLGL